MPIVVKEETFGTTLAVAVDELSGALNGGSPIISYHIQYYDGGWLDASGYPVESIVWTI